MITQLGYIVIPLTIIVLLFKPKYLLYLTVFFSTFTASSIINIKSSMTGIQPVYFIGSAWIGYVIIKNFYEIVIRKRKDLRSLFISYDKKMIVSLIIFIVVSFLSIFMPIILEGKFSVVRPDKSINVIGFSSMNITQYIYLLFMFFIAFSIIVEVKDKKTIDMIIKIFVYSTLFATIWGIAQFLMNYMGVRYPHELFNNNIAYSQQYGQTILSIKRINSIAIEPSMLALNLIIIVPLLVMLWLGNFKIFNNKNINNIFFVVDIVLTILVAILTTSTSAYIGLAISVLMILIFIFRFSEKHGLLYANRKKILLIIAIGIVAVIIAIGIMVFLFKVDFNMIREVINKVTISKLNNDSGMERMDAFRYGINLFLNSPILGIGWGSYRSYDLFTNLLSLTGILGLISFCSFIVTSIISAIKTTTIYNEAYKSAFIISTVVAVILLLLGIPDLTFAYFWIIVILTGFIDNLEVIENENWN